jgi:predicted lipoprotein with Yx(FWY)xxD motif
MFRQVQRALQTRTALISWCSALVAAVAGCASQQPTSSPTTATTSPVGRTVELALRDGVLVDSAGRALYVNDQERGGSLRCVQACLDGWIPVLAPPTGAPAGPVPGLGVLHRSDNGLDQLTYLRQPLYQFRMDSPGRAGGDGVRDSFRGTELTWSVVRISAPGNPTPGLSAGNGF